MTWMTTATTGHFCTGSLVAPDLVLTAAHCVYDASTMTLATDAQLSVYVGAVDLSASGVSRYGVSAFQIDPSFTVQPWNNDLAVLQLATPVTQPAVLLDGAMSGNAAATNQLWVAGWGATNNAGTQATSILSQVPLPLGSAGYCAAEWPADYVDATMICAGTGNGTGVCHGDSGGPLAAWDATGLIETLVGVTSFVSAPACNALPDVFMRVSAARSWLDPLIASVGPAVSHVQATSVGQTTVAVTGAAAPAGGDQASATWFEWSAPDGSGDHTTPAAAFGPGTGAAPETATVTGLVPAASYRIRIVASNGSVQAASSWLAFTTTATPQRLAVQPVSIQSVNDSAGHVSAVVSPAGGSTATTVRFRWSWPDGSHQAMSPPVSYPPPIGSQIVTAAVAIGGLRAATRYRVRIEATVGATIAASAWTAFTTTDHTPPTLRVDPVSGTAKRGVRLRLWLSDNSDRAGVQVRVYHGSRVIGRSAFGPLTLGGGGWWYLRYTPPRNPAGRYRYCARAFDVTGNSTRWVCAALALHR
jgi:hypothetical protein